MGREGKGGKWVDGEMRIGEEEGGGEEERL